MDLARFAEDVTSEAPPEDLLVLGALAEVLAPEDLRRSLDAVVSLLQAATGADGCEIFLREPDGDDLVLAACCGSDRDALMEVVRFETGSGYPGLVATTGEPLLTRHLDRDRRFLRRRVPEGGVVCFASVPLWGTDEVLGCIDLAWRAVNAPVERGAALLERAARPIATTVRASLLAAREAVDRAVDAAGPGLVARANACLEVLGQRAGTRGGTLALYDADGGETTVLGTADMVHTCADAADGKLRCRPLAEGHGVVLTGARNTWPVACRCLPNTTVSPLCLPLKAGGRLRGIVVLDRGVTAPDPPGPDLVPLLAMAAQVAARLVPDRADTSAVGATAGSATPVLEIHCLGGFEVRLHGQPIPTAAFGRKKALTLLKLLVLRAGNPISRVALAEQLWPGVDERAGANRLHGVLHALRSTIEPFREQRRWLFACNIGDLCYFNMESPHWTDLFAFRRHAAGAHEAERRGRREEAIRHLESALRLYRGDLLADEPYASWCDLERAELRHRYIDMTGRLADLWFAEGEALRGISWLRRGLLADPLREDVHQKLIRALIALGRRPEALGQYEVCVRLLHDELGADPLPETQRLVRFATEAVPRTHPSRPPRALPLRLE